MTDLVAAARFEVASRAKNYPVRVASGKLSAAEATVDFQAWSAIAEFLSTGRSPAGWFDDSAGADKKVDWRIVVEWMMCEEAAQRAVDTTGEALVAATAAGAEAKVARLTSRLAALQMISRGVSQERCTIERLNRALADQRTVERKAA